MLFLSNLSVKISANLHLMIILTLNPIVFLLNRNTERQNKRMITLPYYETKPMIIVQWTVINQNVSQRLFNISIFSMFVSLIIKSIHIVTEKRIIVVHKKILELPRVIKWTLVKSCTDAGLVCAWLDSTLIYIDLLI